MAELNDYINRGFSIINDDVKSTQTEQQTLVILGAPRGGTSAIAGCLDILGIPLGDKAPGPVFEDYKLSEYIENDHPEQAIKLINTYQKKYSVWAYKRPGFVHNVANYHQYFTNPSYIVVYRDVFATANRNAISGALQNSITSKMSTVLNSYNKINQFLEQTAPRALLISYEKLLLNPQIIVRFICEQLAIDATEEKMAEAASFIQPDPEEYIDKTRSNQVYGAIESITPNRLSGWASFKSILRTKPVRVDLLINGKLIDTVIANQPTTSEAALKKADNRHCGFEIDLSQYTLKPNDSVALIAKGEIHQLENSPVIVPNNQAGLIQTLKNLFS